MVIVMAAMAVIIMGMRRVIMRVMAVVVMAVPGSLGGIGRCELVGEHAGNAGDEEAEERQEDDRVIHALSPSSR